MIIVYQKQVIRKIVEILINVQLSDSVRLVLFFSGRVPDMPFAPGSQRADINPCNLRATVVPFTEFLQEIIQLSEEYGVIVFRFPHDDLRSRLKPLSP